MEAVDVPTPAAKRLGDQSCDSAKRLGTYLVRRGATGSDRQIGH